MIKTYFGIIEQIDPNEDYRKDFANPEKHDCVFIDDDEYINDWWGRLVIIKTYFGSLNHPATALDRWGVTLIPPESLPAFQAIIIEDKRIYKDDHLVALANKVQQAINEKKYMIHLGV